MSRWYLYPELVDREKLIGLLSEGMSVRRIADRLGCTRSSVESALKNHGLKRPIVVRVSMEVRKRLRL